MGKGEIKLETYQRSTNLIKARYEKINVQVNEIVSKSIQSPLTQVQIRSLTTYLNEMRKKRADFEGNFQRIIESADEEVSESDLSADVDAVNDLYIQVVSQIEALLPPDDPMSPASAANASFQSLSQPVHSVRLPQLDLKTFNGDVTNWVAFVNLFDATVHHNPTLSSVIKFQYLLSSLSGEPLNLIKSMNISAANYPIAYQILKDRYHNSRRLSSLHLNAILDLPSIRSGNITQLRQFLNLFAEHTQSLQALQCDISTAQNPLLSAHLLRKLDQELRKKLENFRSSQDCDVHSLPTVQHIIQFLNNECNQTEDASLHFPQNDTRSSAPHASYKQRNSRLADQHSQPRSHALVAARDGPSPRNPPHHPSSGTSGAQSRTPHPSLSCFLCNKPHRIYTCELFLSKTPNERSNIVKTHNRCYGCLGSHMIDKCTSKNVCNTCQKKHHSLLHFDRKSSSISTPTQMATPPPAVSQPTQQTGSNNTLVAHAAHNKFVSPCYDATTVLLGTALVKVTASNGNSHVLRCLIDSGSQLSFVSEHAMQLLNAPRVHSTHEITGIATATSRTKGVAQLDLSTLGGKLIASQHQLHILDRISSDLPRVRISPDVWQLTRSYVLADPTFDRPGRVDLLIGGALYPLLFTQESHPLGENLPHLVGTHFGYVVMGVAPCDLNSPPSSYFVALHSACDSAELHSSLQRFWIQEEPPRSTHKSTEDELCDKHFIQTHTRTEDGRYVVRLPFQPEHPPLGQSRPIAEKRLLSLERKFDAQPRLKQLYVDSMRECISSEHMTKVTTPNLSSPHNYLPHHGVLKINGDSEKLRVVYDASCKTSSGFSLNDLLMTGPKLQVNISDVLLQFRTHNIVFTCDIRQMYLQIMVQPPDHLFQLVLWRESPSHPMSTYSLNRVTFGVNSSPYLALRTLRQLADDEGHDYPAAAEVIRTQTYVDDIVSGADTVEEAKILKDQLIKLLNRGGFELRKWTSNSPDLLCTLPEAHRETPVFFEDSKEPKFSILGLRWSPESDVFSYDLNFPSCTPTKRHILSMIARIYDPCGFLSPCVMTAKCFMQLLWTTGLQWDDILTPDLTAKWETFVSNLSSLSSIKIPRALHLSSSVNIQVHGYSDASEAGYSAVIYFRCQQQNGDVIVRQVLAKTRVSPLKRVTLPRLELCAAHLLTQLVSYCCEMFNLKATPQQCYLWCDSSVALSWLQTPSYRLKTYVANRVSQAQELIPNSCWHYIPSKDNPADCASRGILASELVTHPIWWTGPQWLRLPPSQWPDISFTPSDPKLMDEVKTIPLTVLTTSQSNTFDLLSKFSSWDTLQRVTARVLRFIQNVKQPKKILGPLTAQELKNATLCIFKLVQAESFSEDLLALKKNRNCSHQLQRLSPFIHEDGLLRVGGRIRKADIPITSKHTIILPKRHHVVNLFIEHIHKRHLHSGIQLTQAILAETVWILSARSAVRSCIFKCMICFRHNPKNQPPLMGDLPSVRVNPARPFLSTGLDFGGPFLAKAHTLRSAKHIKVYICVMVCMVTKAVHIEMVTDLTTEAFLAALTRFVSRRGLCADIYSDCGTNFVGANTALKNIVKNLKTAEAREEIGKFTATQGITFHFNPPAAPHQGGLWEAAIKSAKHHLKHVIGQQVLTFAEFSTLTTRVEAMLNSRPLTPLSSDPTDLSALTPGHFLIGGPLTSVPETSLLDTPLPRLKAWRLVQALHQHIWRRWQREYIHTLQQRHKWTTPSANLKPGDLVLVHQPTPPLTWPLGRIIEVFPGDDGAVRVVKIKTQTSTISRPSVKVFPLPLN